MFDLYGEHAYPIKYRGTIHEVIIRFTIAKEEARLGYNAGDKLHGKHAAKNLGVSIIRAGRELDIDLSIVNSYDTRERWWGIEVAFPPALDEIFGVTNNKQAARYFSDVLKLDFEDFCKREDASPTEVLQNMREDGDPHAHLIEIVRHMKDNLKTMRSLIKMQVKGNQAQMRNIGNEAENLATEATRERQEKGYIGQSDEGEKRPVEERKEEIEKTLKDMGTSQETVNSLIRATFNPVGTLKYIFNHADVETQAFFIVKLKAGEIIISLNTNHPAYDKLFEILEEETDIDDVKTLQTHLKKAREALKLLFMAWARYEDEQPDGEKKSIAQQVRYDWGIIARQFLSGE